MTCAPLDLLSVVLFTIPTSETVEEPLHSRLQLVVPRGEACLRCQISAGHDTEQLDQAVEALAAVGKELGLI